MTHATLDRPSFHVLGLALATTSGTATRDIAGLWERAAARQIFDGSEAVAVYDHYTLASGELAYTVTVGRLGQPGEPVPEGLSLVEVPAQRCLAIVTDGSIAGIQQAWGEVWQRWPDGGPRALVADVEHWQMGPAGRPVGATIYLGMRT